MMTYDPAFMNTAACRSKITFIDGDKGILLYRGYPIEQLAEHSDFLETSYLLLFGELPSDTAARGLDARNRRTRCCPRTSGSWWKASARTRTRWACSSADRRRCRPSIRKPRTSPTRSSRRLQMVRLDRQGAERSRPMRYRHLVGRPFVLPDSRSELYGQLPQHAVQDDGGSLQAAPRARARARRAVHPARRPRAELQHGDDAQYRQLARRPVCGAGGRSGGALRPAARRRQRGGAAHARARSGRQGERPGVHQARQERRGPADGLRPPGLQVVRSARQDHQAHRRPGVRGHRQEPAARDRRSSSSASRWKTTTSCRGSSTRTWTSTPASSTRPWGSRSTCSRCCSPFRAPPAGWPSGKRC